jgi:RecB family exonuclease
MAEPKQPGSPRAKPEPKPKKLTLSPTRLSDYLHCPRYYWYLYHKKYRRRPHGALSLGANLHRSLEMIHAPDRPSLEELLVQFQRDWSGAGFSTAEEERAGREAGEAMLQRYVQEAPPPEEMPETVLREKMLKMDRGFYILQGRIDRLDQWPDGTLDIVDYKSGRREVTEEQVRAEIGLMVYEILVRHHFPLHPVRVAIHALRPNVRVTVERTPEEFAAIVTLIDDVARAIAAEEAWRGVSTPSCCEGCDFAHFCPDFRKD